MKKIVLITLLILPFFGKAQESYGNTANLGLGIGYGYGDRFRSTLPIFHFNYEFDVAPNFTLAPFVTLIHYRTYSNWNGNKYRYRSTIIPLGLRACYYFDEILNLDSRFDIYLGGAIAFNLHNERWDDGYFGPAYNGGFTNLYLDGTLGAEFHINEKIGLILDLSTGISTFGIALHQ